MQHATPSLAVNPFGMLVDPQAVARALEGSQRLECLNRRVCRPLDRQTPAKPAEGDRAAFDAELDQDESPLSDE